MAANVDGIVREAIRAYKGGNREEAQALLIKATELDQMHEEAWLWLGAVVETVEDQRVCLENVLYINPNNERALKGMEQLEGSNDNPMVVRNLVTEEEPVNAGGSFEAAFEDVFADTGLDESEEEPAFVDVPLSGGPFGGASLDFSLEEEPTAPVSVGTTSVSEVEAPVEVERPRSPTEPSLARQPEPEEDERDLGEYFHMIPADVKLTRLPGTEVKQSSLGTLTAIILGLLNVVALVFLVSNLMG